MYLSLKIWQYRLFLSKTVLPVSKRLKTKVENRTKPISRSGFSMPQFLVKEDTLAKRGHRALLRVRDPFVVWEINVYSDLRDLPYGGNSQKRIILSKLSRVKTGNESPWKLWPKGCKGWMEQNRKWLRHLIGFFKDRCKLSKHLTVLGLEITRYLQIRRAIRRNSKILSNELWCFDTKTDLMPDRLLCAHGTSAVQYII